MPIACSFQIPLQCQKLNRRIPASLFSFAGVKKKAMVTTTTASGSSSSNPGSYTTIRERVTFQREIKKSKFIAIAGPISDQQSAHSFLSEVGDQRATHNCWAYKVGDQYRSSDDGEPSGTAGKPIYSAIVSSGIDRVMVPMGVEVSFDLLGVLYHQLQSFQVEDIKQDYDTGKDGTTMVTFKVDLDRVESLEDAVKANFGREGSGGSVAVGRVGIAGNGGTVGLGRVGMVGSVGAAGGAAGVSKRVGAVGSEGNGGNVALGRVGIAGNGGNVGLGRVGIVGSVGADGIWVLGNGGNVGFGKVGAVGREGNGGRVAVGRVGIAGIGGNVGLGRVGIVGTVSAGGGAAGVSKRWRAAKVISVFHNDSATIKDKMKQSLETAIV
ncbi:hypothetical protein L1049_024780 [Liquidambar formosana]|uniref:Impact N-terminal domain-containing protein n=1 Tax=Liquidambar formosana TaxID=63359 RepID=A0AAP0RVD6_LIQFO